MTDQTMMNLTWMDLIKVTVAYRIPYRICRILMMDLTWMDLMKVTVAYRIPYRILTSNLHQTVYVANYHA